MNIQTPLEKHSSVFGNTAPLRQLGVAMLLTSMRIPIPADPQGDLLIDCRNENRLTYHGGIRHGAVLLFK